MTKVVVSLDGAAAACDLLLVPGGNLITGETEVAATLGELTSLESDLLRVVAAVFAADLATKRGDREGFVRDFDLTIPVVNLHAFQHLSRDLSNLLYVVSDDNWSLTFTPAPGQPEGHTEWPATEDGCTLLFSGGLDSLAAAIDLLEAGTPLGLASHYTANPVIRGSQNNLLVYLETTFGAGCAPRLSARITGRNTATASFPDNDAREPSQRTRSVMFLALAALSARRSGRRRLLVIAENGQMAIHLPLTAARIGAFSTHTAHPEFVRNAQDFLSAVLGVPFKIENPFLYRTKAECVARAALAHPTAIPLSVSCWKSSRQAYSHCGECVPCLIRRIALAANGIALDEYERDMFAVDVGSLAANDTGKVNLLELAEFIIRFQENDDAALIEAYPELMNQHVQSDAAMAMYRRFAVEALAVLAAHPPIAALLA